ncbi:MAG: hypothetical protein ACFE0Q_13035 [Anaerolineae bacterium]
MYRKFLSLLILFALAPLTLTAQDDTSDAGLIAYFNNQLYRLTDDALVPYDACMPDETIAGEFIASPDHMRFLIGTVPTSVEVARQELGSLGDAPYGLNYWLCDMSADTLERLIVQPGADDPFNDELPPIEYVMSRVSWSPDGTQLAWTQLNFADDSQVAVILDLATDEQTQFTLDLPLAPFPAPPELIGWVAEQGLLLWVFEFDDVTFLNIETLHLVDVNEQAISASYEILNAGETDDFYNQRELVQTPDGVRYALEFDERGWVLIDPATGEQIPASGQLALTVLDNPDSLTLRYAIDFEFNYNWQFSDPTLADIVLRAYPPERIALAPDGERAAYADSTLHIIDAEGTVTDIANSDGFADDFLARVMWGASPLTFINLDAEELAPPTACENAPPVRLSEGEIARVISATVPNRIRSLPTTEGAIVGEIPGNGELIVRGGPVCAENYTWLQIEYGTVTGWTVEGTGTNYFLEPLD